MNWSIVALFATTIVAAEIAAADITALRVGPVPATVRQAYHLAPFYQKHIDAGGLPIVSSSKVADCALLEAAWLINQMLDGRNEIRRAIIRSDVKVRVAIMATTEFTTDLPEHSDLKPKPFWDKRARGLGATAERPAVSCGEENLLCYPGDPYVTENILIHEFGHVIHEVGMKGVDPQFDSHLEATYLKAMKDGLWSGKYASQNRMEYWAEGVQSWFDTNRVNDHDHNEVHTRAQLKEYDPGLSKLLAEVFGDKPWRYVEPAKRADLGHLKNCNLTKLPTFRWPAELIAWNKSHPDGAAAEADGVLLPLLAAGQTPPPASPRSDRKTLLYFINHTQTEVLVYWNDWSGKLKPSARLRAGESVEENTFVGHVFVITDLTDKPLAVVVADEKPGRAVIEPAATPKQP